MLRDSEESFPLTADTYEDDTGEALEAVLTRAGFTIGEAFTLRTLRIRWPLMGEDEFARRELNSMLDGLAVRKLFCDREKLTAMIFSPDRPDGEPWTARLQWLLTSGLAGGFHFRSTASRRRTGRWSGWPVMWVRSQPDSWPPWWNGTPRPPAIAPARVPRMNNEQEGVNHAH